MTSKERFQRRLHKYLILRPRTEGEIRTYLSRLARKAFPWITDKIVEDEIFKLKNRLVIDDAQFVRWWVADRLNFKPRSERLLRYELQQKGVDSEIIDQNFTPDENLDQQTLLDIVSKRAIKPMWYENKYKKLYAYLQRRGYRYADIRNAIEEVTQKR